LLAAVAVPVSGQQMPALRIGHTDHEIIIANMPEALEIQQELQAAVTEMQQEIQVLADDFQADLERYRRTEQLISEERKQEREAELQAAAEEIQRKEQEAQRDLTRLEVDLLGPIYQRVEAAIQKVAEEKGLDIVIRSRVGPEIMILYVNPDRITDITLDVAIELGIDVGEGGSAAGEEY